MAQPIDLVEVWRGPILESIHRGHAVICDDQGHIVQAWGDPDAVILPHSSAKMLQALPLLTSGAADAIGLTPEHLALACASHQGAPMHTDRVAAWLQAIGAAEKDLRCGVNLPYDEVSRNTLICSGDSACQIHHECSGKHAGFLTLNAHLRGGPDYIDPDHPVQKAVRDAFEDATGLPSPAHGIDGCSAPNFATTMHGFARAMARYAAAPEGSAENRLTHAMMAHPELVAGETRACTELMRALNGRAAVKTGAEAFFAAILPEQKLGMAVKISDGTVRASQSVITALLVKCGVLDEADPMVGKWRDQPQINARGINTGVIRPVAELLS